MKKRPLIGAYARARRLRRDMTAAERKLWGVVRMNQIDGTRFRRQVPIGPYIADFACHDANLLVEIDGGQHDLSSELEIERMKFLEQEGYRVIRFWNNEVLTNIDGVYLAIVSVLGCITPTQPSPIKGEGLL